MQAAGAAALLGKQQEQAVLAVAVLALLLPRERQEQLTQAVGVEAVQ
jgi:hypothetical protein